MEQIKMNKLLCDAMEVDDYKKIESLLKDGANPLGSYDERDIENIPLANFFDKANSEVENNPEDTRISKMVSLLIENGLLDYIKYDEERRDNLPLYDLAFACSKDAAIAFKMILDAGYCGLSINEFIEHFWSDLYLSNFMEFKDWKIDEDIAWGIRMMMLAASYPEVLNNNEYLQGCIELENNNDKNSALFKNYNDYFINYDESTCVEKNKMDGLTVNMVSNDKVIWTIHM